MDGSREQNLNTNKVERKVIEKNRRDHMKFLCSQLNSLIPNHNSNESSLSIPDQIDQAINYIKSLEIKLKDDKEKKEWLMKNSMSSSSASASSSQNNKKAPELKVKEMGSTIEVALTTELEDRFVFYEAIRILNEERVNIINVSYSVLENTAFYSIHAEIEDVVYEFEATKLRERLNRLARGWEGDAQIMQAAEPSLSDPDVDARANNDL